MKHLFKASLLSLGTLVLISCSTSNRSKSSLTGWNYNDPKYGGYIQANDFYKQKVPEGMVAIEGGTFMMGQVQDDFMFDWNTTPKQMHVRSFYMDESEVTNSEYVLYLEVIKDVYPAKEEKYKNVYSSALPDTLVWRNSLGNTDLLSENYLRHPAYKDYPVVGISWLQANRYCKWRTDAVNLKTLIDRGVIDNILEKDSIRNFFDTDLYLEDPYRLFDGDSAVYKRGLPDYKTGKKGEPKSGKGLFSGRHVTSADGILTQKFRLPTEAEWEYAAKANSSTREGNNLRGRKKYPWSGEYKNKSTRYKGNPLANFKQGQGDYSGIAGWMNDGGDIPVKINSYPPNPNGLYDMAGNVSEWVSDVYRPLIDSEASDFNYFRGNVFTKKYIDPEGNVVVIGEGEDATIKYDTLPNGQIVPLELPGEIKYIPVSERDTYMRRNYHASDNRDVYDGDEESSIYYYLDKEQFDKEPRMYNSPTNPTDSIGHLKYDNKKRWTLISDRTRVYKGGSWSDREYWLDPAQRRYLPEYMSSNAIGFRCASDILGAVESETRSKKPTN